MGLVSNVAGEPNDYSARACRLTNPVTRAVSNLKPVRERLSRAEVNEIVLRSR